MRPPRDFNLFNQIKFYKLDFPGSVLFSGKIWNLFNFPFLHQWIWYKLLWQLWWIFHFTSKYLIRTSINFFLFHHIPLLEFLWREYDERILREKIPVKYFWSGWCSKYWRTKGWDRNLIIAMTGFLLNDGHYVQRRERI